MTQEQQVHQLGASSGSQEAATQELIWYVTSNYSTDITPREITRHTKESVFFMAPAGQGRKAKEVSERKRSGYHCWFPTEAEAAAHYVEQYTEQANQHQSQVDHYRSKARVVQEKYAAALARSQGTPQENAEAK